MYEAKWNVVAAPKDPRFTGKRIFDVVLDTQNITDW